MHIQSILFLYQNLKMVSKTSLADQQTRRHLTEYTDKRSVYDLMKTFKVSA